MFGEREGGRIVTTPKWFKDSTSLLYVTSLPPLDLNLNSTYKTFLEL